MRLSRVLVLAFLLCASPGDAQPDRFIEAVRDLAQAATIDGSRRPPIGPVIERMASALAEWDRSISALEGRVNSELRGARLRQGSGGQAPDQRAFQLRVELGLAQRRRGRFAEAMREFDAAAALMPKASDIHVLRALTFEATGELDNAARAFAAAWSLDPQNPVKAYYVLLHRSGPDLDRARRTLAGAYERNLKGGRKDTPFLTLDVLSSTPSVAPVVADAALSEGFALLAAARYNEALDALRRSTRPSSAADSPIAHFTRARSYEAENRIAEARREYEAAVPGVLTGRGLLYVGMGRLAQVEGDNPAAIDLFVRAVRLIPNDPMVHRELASALAADDRVDDALAELVAALMIDPGDSTTMAAIGQLFLDSGRYADAIPALTRTLQLAPDRFEAHYALGAAMTHLGRAAEAAREFELFERARTQMVEKRRSDLR